MKSNPQQIAKKALHVVRKWKSQPTVEKIMLHESPTLSVIGNALSETLDHIISQEELNIVSKIEERRFSLLRSDKSILMVDFGAGSADTARTENEMKRGIRSRLTVSKICQASNPAFWSLFLFKMVRKLKPNSCLELGSCFGISAAYQSAALILNKKGKLLTLEGSPEIARIAEETLSGLSFGNASVMTGPFHETYHSSLESARPVDFLFNDGHHDHDAMLRYYYDALPYLSEEAVILFDDISWSSGMKKAWGKIMDNERINVAIQMRSLGIAVLSDNPYKGRFYNKFIGLQQEV